MANDIRALAKAIKDIEKKVKKALKKRAIPTEIGEMSKDMVVERTRKGFGVDETEGKKQRLSKLAKSTKSIRRGLKKQGKLSSKTTPNRSNFTRTGKSLDNIKVRPNNNKVEITLDSHGKKAVKQTEQIPGKGKGFNFMTLSQSESRKVKKTIQERITETLKKYL